jgi:hypothetical protein
MPFASIDVGDTEQPVSVTTVGLPGETTVSLMGWLTLEMGGLNEAEETTIVPSLTTTRPGGAETWISVEEGIAPSLAGANVYELEQPVGLIVTSS